jgi:hypothetical protein
MRKELSGRSDIRIPDISKYEAEESLGFGVLHSGWGRMTRSGYEIYFDVYPEKKAETSDFFYLYVNCKNIEEATDKTNPHIPPKTNMTYRSVPVVRFEGTMPVTEDSNKLFPEGSSVYLLTYRFDLGGCAYVVNGQVYIDPEDTEDADGESSTAGPQAELLALVDSILDDGRASVMMARCIMELTTAISFGH